MKELGEALAGAVFVALVLALFFLFLGEPDVWDRLHELAMKGAECRAATGKQQ